MRRERIERLHWSPELIYHPLDDCIVRINDVYHKPPGFWYSIGDDWRLANHDGRVSLGGRKFKYCYRVIVGKTRILSIKTLGDMAKFNKRFSFGSHLNLIAWPAIATCYDGIEIQQYFRSLRLDMRYPWYYPWDCASGVIWNASKLKLKENFERG